MSFTPPTAREHALSAAARALPPLPQRMRALPRDHRGFPVPWFVAFIEGKPDFRIVREHGVERAVRQKLCWICGSKLTGFFAFVIGPMCAVNRVSSEPPSHLNCALFAARACPFLANPRMRRNEKDMPGEAVDPAGEMIKRNPGVALVWGTRAFERFAAPTAEDPHGMLFDVGEPARLDWFAHGRAATREECLASIESGLPILEDMARAQGPAAEAALAAQLKNALTLLPKALAA